MMMISINADTGNQTSNTQNDETKSLVNATWILAGGTIAIGIVTIFTLFQTNRTHQKQIVVTDKQNRMTALMEIFKTLSDEEHRKARRITYKARREYNISKDIGVFGTLQHYKEVGITASHFNQVGMLIQKDIIPKEEFFDLYADTTILCWKSLKEYIENKQKEKNSSFYMNYFVWLGEQALIYWEKNRPEEPLPEPS